MLVLRAAGAGVLDSTNVKDATVIFKIGTRIELLAGRELVLKLLNDYTLDFQL